MNVQRRVSATVVLVALVVAACGSSASPDPVPAGGAPTSAGSPGAAPTDAPATDAPATTPAVTEPTSGGNGGSAGDACDLVTTDEVGGVLGVQGVSITLDSPGTPSYCIYGDAGGNGILATSLMTTGGATAFGLWQTGVDVEPIDGVGDDAVFDPTTASFLVLVGDAVFTVAAGDGTSDTEQRLAWGRRIAEIALGRI